MWFRIARILGPSETMIHDDFYKENDFPIQADIDFDEVGYKKDLVKRGGTYSRETEFLDDILTKYAFDLKGINIPCYLNKE